MEWRIAKVTDTSSPNYDPNAPRDYEITTLWESGELTVSTNPVNIPGNYLQSGLTYRVRVRFKDAAGRWSHWSDAVQFVAAPPASPLNQYLRITEIMYNPPAPTAAEIAAGYTDNNSFEYVELTNTGSTPLQLSGIKLSQAVTFTFGNTTLQPGQYILVVRDISAFNLRYGSGYNIAGAIPANSPMKGSWSAWRPRAAWSSKNSLMMTPILGPAAPTGRAFRSKPSTPPAITTIRTTGAPAANTWATLVEKV